jgi:hypothetical protein
MRVDVDDFDFDHSSSTIKDFSNQARLLHNDLNSCCNYSEGHVKTNEGKIDSKIASWNSKLARLNEMKRQLENEIKTHNNNRDQAIKRANSAANNHNSSTDQGKRDGYKREYESACRTANEEAKKAQEKSAKLALVIEDIRVATQYLNELNVIKGTNHEARNNLEVSRKYINSAINIADRESDRCLRAIDEMENHINRFNSFSYGSSYQYGNSYKISVPTFHNVHKIQSRPAPARVARAGTNAPKLTLPEKMRLISTDGNIVEIIGPYTEKAELGRDLSELKKLLPGKCSVCIKKPITSATPCFANIKELAEFVALFGFSGKMTSMGTRYVDGDGRIYFNN